ncbi:MAG: glucosyl-3-phosphoglycerate synthase [Halobacteriota archaeon]|nr:glucosyl-3-phosphoglycerate synthase [Halobacteriota archaeon]
MDFSQELVTTIQDIGGMNGEKLRKRLEDLTIERPATLVIPMLYSELQNGSLRNIIEHLNRCTYLTSVVIALTAKNDAEYKETVDFFRRLTIPHIIVWCESPHIKEVFYALEDKGININAYSGKGKAVWVAIGIASLESYAILFHDADVESYTSNIPARLLLPILDPEMDFFFSKGYYARVSDSKLYGRVTRLFVYPFIDALSTLTEHKSPYLSYLRAFKYPLSGEFAMTTDLAMNIRVPTDWGLEIGVLSEIYRNSALRRICQVDLGVYSHTHREVGNDITQGLLKTVSDIVKTTIRTLTENDGLQIAESNLLGLQVMYKKMAHDDIRKYHTVSNINEFDYDRHEEESLVETFARIIQEGGRDYLSDPSAEQISDWLRVISAITGIRGNMVEVIPMKDKLQERLMEAALLDLG